MKYLLSNFNYQLPIQKNKNMIFPLTKMLDFEKCCFSKKKRFYVGSREREEEM